MFGFWSPEAAQRSPGSPNPTKRFTKRIQNGSFASIDAFLNALKRASRRVSSNKPEIPTELCPRCLEHVLDRSWDPVHGVRHVTSLSLAFDGFCSQQEPHIAEILGTMGNLRHLELLDARITSSFYAMLAEKAQFQLEYFACKSPPFDYLLRFLSTQRHLLEIACIGGSLETQTITRVRGQEIMCTVRTLSTTAPLLLHPQLNATSLRHLEYTSSGQSLRQEVRAIEKIGQLGPQLRSLRFIWGTGRAETFLDVTKFFCIAANTSSIKYIALLGISRNVFEQFVATGLRRKTWKKLQTLLWVPNPPHGNDLDEPESPISPMLPSSIRFTELSGGIKAGHPLRLRRQSTASSWHSTSSAISSRSAISSLTMSISSRRTRCSSTSDLSRIDLDFRIHCIGKDLMNTFPTLRRLALWNWDRMGYDLFTRTADGSLVWTYNVEIDEYEWLSV